MFTAFLAVAMLQAADAPPPPVLLWSHDAPGWTEETVTAGCPHSTLRITRRFGEGEASIGISLGDDPVTLEDMAVIRRLTPIERPEATVELSCGLHAGGVRISLEGEDHVILFDTSGTQYILRGGRILHRR